MTVTLVGGPVFDEAAWRDWHPMLSGRAPGVAVALPMEDRLRLVVLDLADSNGLGAEVVRQVSHPAMTLTASELADQLVDTYLGRSRCASVAIADLRRDGRLELQARAAPPAVLLSRARAARLLPGTSTGAVGRSERLVPGEVLVLCSASFLEDPPAVLGTIRRSSGQGTDAAQLRQELRACGHRGATASVTIPRP